MYQCPNCNANIRYSPKHGQLYCSHCDTTMDPYDFEKEKDAKEGEEYEVMVFTCPQCGGAIATEDDTSAAFCTFCGGSTILDSRLKKEKRPKLIIPFGKTKEDCRNAYLKAMKRAFFAPDDFKKSEHIESFRGIYVPYWLYNVDKNCGITVKGEITHRSGDYIIYDRYDVVARIDAQAASIPFDASSSFADDISGAIAPFDVREAKPFTPSYLSGFYADTADVHSALYEDDALDVFATEIESEIMSNPEYKKHGVTMTEYNKNELRGYVRDKHLGLFPVWFLCHRFYHHGEVKITYAAVNGQTGKLCADIPISPKKYIRAVAIITPLIAFILLLFENIISVDRSGMMIILAILSSVSSAICMSEQQMINGKVTGEGDKGIRSRMLTKPHYMEKLRQDATRGKKSDFEKAKGSVFKAGAYGIVGAVLGIITCVMNFPADLIFYIIGIVIGILGLLQFMLIIDKFNDYALREYPQFKRTGGDDLGI